MDRWNRVVSTVLIKDGKFASVGWGFQGFSACTKVINLRGRTVIPGITDNHNHIILLGLRPGRDVRLDKANSIQDALDLLAGRAAEVNPGEWVVSLGGLSRNQFVPPPDAPRFPNLDELDAAVPDNPALLFEGFVGPSQTNSSGKAFFEAAGVPVADDGSIGGGFFGPSMDALQALRDLPQHNNLEAQKQGLIDALQFGVSVGITTHVDQGSFHFAESYFGNTGSTFGALASFDQYRAFDSVRALHSEKELPARVQINYLHGDPEEDTPQLEQRLLNTVPFLGDQWLANGGIGEFTAGSLGFTAATGEVAWQNGTRLAAQHGWRNENHSLTGTDFMEILDFWGMVDSELKTTGIPQTPANPDPGKATIINPDGITQLRWVLAHVPFIDETYINISKDLGVGLSLLGGWRWLSGSPGNAGPPFRTILDLGARAGMSSDGMQISVMDPWTGIYYAVTGKNARGEVINGDETISREEALRLYTSDNAWFLGQQWQRKLGSIEKGKWADLVVLSDDYFDESKVSDEDIKDIHSVMTVVNGKIVHFESLRRHHYDLAPVQKLDNAY
jgi:predicted amidohydrolase YtcJ